MKLLKVSKSFNDKKVISEFSYHFPKNGTIFIQGSSGKGKTTLLNIISGLITPDCGELELEPVSYLFQEDRLIESVSVLENVMCVNNDKNHCIEILSNLGLKNEIYSLPVTLSGGMKRRVAIARTLVFGANIVLLDEPFKGLDLITLEKTIQVIKEKTADKLLIIVSHESDRKYFEKYDVITL